MKILLIRFSSIGDIVLTTPLLRCIKAQKPDVEVHYLTKKQFGPVLAHNPHIDRLHFLEGDDLPATVQELKAEKFDFIADLHHNLRTLRVKDALKVNSASFPKLNIQKWIRTNLRLPVMPDKSIVDRYFETLKPLGIANDGGGLEYYIGKEGETNNEDIPTSHWHGYVACVIGGSYFTKKLPVAQWQRFCQAVPFPLILLGSMDDRDEGNAIAAVDPVKIYNSCGKFSLNESADLIRRSRVVASNDTGLMHVAAAFQKPIVSFWGNTSPDLGMYPYYGGNNLYSRVSPKSLLLERKKLYCHPCSKLGYKKCPHGHFKCMKDLDMTEAAAAVARFWKMG